MAVASADDEADAREDRILPPKLAGIDVGVQVIDGDQWQVQ